MLVLLCRLTQLLTFVTQLMTQSDAIRDTGVANNGDLRPFVLKLVRAISWVLLVVLFGTTRKGSPLRDRPRPIPASQLARR